MPKLPYLRLSTADIFVCRVCVSSVLCQAVCANRAYQTCGCSLLRKTRPLRAREGQNFLVCKSAETALGGG